MKKIFLILTLFISFTNSAFADKPDAGDLAPDFTISQLDGSNFKLSDYKGKKSVYLIFWNTWCGYCLKKVPKLKQTQKTLSDDIVIIAVNTTKEDSIEEIDEFIKKFNVNYPIAFDYGKKVTDLYNVWGTPTEFIIDINGVVRYRDDVPEKLEDYLAEWNTIEKLYSGFITAYKDMYAFFHGAVRHSANETAG